MEKYTLKHPIEVDGAKINEVSIRRPKFRDIKKIDVLEDDLARIEILLVDLGQMTLAEVAELDFEDFTGLSDIVGKFFPSEGADAEAITNPS